MNIQITPNKKNLIVLDIDGCVIDSEDRLPHFLNGDRKTYDELYHTDKTIPAGYLVYSMFLDMIRENPALICLFVTGRSELCREYTLKQLSDLFGSSTVDKSMLLMRPLGAEKEHDTVLKPRLVEEAGYSLDQILLVVEDRDSTVAMWRERGVTCWQTQPGSF